MGQVHAGHWNLPISHFFHQLRDQMTSQPLIHFQLQITNALYIICYPSYPFNQDAMMLGRDASMNSAPYHVCELYSIQSFLKM